MKPEFCSFSLQVRNILLMGNYGQFTGKETVWNCAESVQFKTKHKWNKTCHGMQKCGENSTGHSVGCWYLLEQQIRVTTNLVGASLEENGNN